MFHIEQVRFGKAPNFSVRVDRIGSEREPVVVIDNFLDQASLLVDYIAAAPAFRAARGYYPGVRAPAPASYVNALHEHLQDIVYEAFDLPRDAIRGVESDYSMVTVRPDQLKPYQRIPHFDSNNRQELAIMHYLCLPEFGGTSFYRHKATGFESVDSSRAEHYVQTVEQQAREQGLPPAAYINGDSELFERVASYDACFNRALIYRCTSLHSGNIGAGFDFNPDPRTGRLSLNTFLLGH